MIDYSELLASLAEEQRALEHLLFKLKEQQLILSAGEQRWLSPATAEVQAAVLGLTAAGERREGAAAAVHQATGLAVTATLGNLADRVEDELVCQHLHQRQRSLRDVLDQVRRCSRQNRQMLAQGLAATNDALALLGQVPTYDSAGGTSSNGLRGIRSFDARV